MSEDEPIKLNQSGVDRLMAQVQVKEATDFELNSLFTRSQILKDPILLEEAIEELKRRRLR